MSNEINITEDIANLRVILQSHLQDRQIKAVKLFWCLIAQVRNAESTLTTTLYRHVTQQRLIPCVMAILRNFSVAHETTMLILEIICWLFVIEDNLPMSTIVHMCEPFQSVVTIFRHVWTETTINSEHRSRIIRATTAIIRRRILIAPVIVAAMLVDARDMLRRALEIGSVDVTIDVWIILRHLRLYETKVMPIEEPHDINNDSRILLTMIKLMARSSKEQAKCALMLLNNISIDETNLYPKEFICPISNSLMQEPTIDRYGNTYDHKNIARWLERSNRSPLNQLPLTSEDLIPNRELKSLMRNYFKNIYQMFSVFCKHFKTST